MLAARATSVERDWVFILEVEKQEKLLISGEMK
jgi:hypothetical protein